MNVTVADSLVANAMPAWLLGELRSAPAGDHGAVEVTPGILWAPQDEDRKNGV